MFNQERLRGFYKARRLALRLTHQPKRVAYFKVSKMLKK